MPQLRKQPRLQLVRAEIVLYFEREAVEPRFDSLFRLCLSLPKNNACI